MRVAHEARHCENQMTQRRRREEDKGEVTVICVFGTVQQRHATQSWRGHLDLCVGARARTPCGPPGVTCRRAAKPQRPQLA